MTDPRDDEDRELAGEYVLGTLPAGERRRIELALPHDPALRAAVQEWERRLLPLTRLAEPTEPSPQLWARVEASLAAALPQRPIAERARWWDGVNLWRGLAAAGFAAAAMMAVVVRLEPGLETDARYMVVLATPDNKAPGWVMRMEADGALTLNPLGTTVVPPDKALQLWTKADNWKGPVSLGLVRPGQPVRVSLASLPPLQPNQLFEITLEPKSGSPIGRPTGPILYIGRAVQVL